MQLIEAGKLAEAIDVGLAAAAVEPSETVHRALMRAYLAEGNQVEALRQFESYRMLLWTELGLTPSPLIVEVAEAIRHPAPTIR